MNSPLPASRYRAIQPLAVASVAVGALAVVTFLSWYLAAIPAAGIALGLAARKRIRNAPDEWTGWTLALVGIWLSAAMWLVGYGWLTFAEVAKVPFGYEEVSYDTLQPDPDKPTEPIPQKALDMQDKKVYIEGYMQPRRTQTGIKDFILCPFNGQCPFCTVRPKPTERIRVILQGDMQTTYTTRLVGVAGRFRVDPNDPTPYGLEADYLH